MTQVVIQCPATRKDIPTGIDLDEATWESASINQGATQCLWCGELHVWSKQEARLEEPAAPVEEAETPAKPAKQTKSAKSTKSAKQTDEQPEQVEQLSMQA